MRRPVAVIFCLVVFTLGACRTNRVTGELESGIVSEASEIDLCRIAASEVEQQFGGLYHDPALNAYIDEIGRKIVAVSHWPDLEFHFAVLNSPEAKSFALPGGRVYLTRGLLSRLANEAQLAGVLGHEIGHVAAGDGARRLSTVVDRDMILLAGTMSASVDDVGRSREHARVVAILADSLDTVVRSGHGPDAERRADRLSLEYAVRAGYDPRELKGRYPAPDRGTFVLHEEQFRRRTARFFARAEALERYDTARRQRANGEYASALRSIDAAIDRASDQPEFYVERGNIHLALNNIDGAELDFFRARVEHFDSFECRIGCGIVLFARRRYIDAEAEFAAAVDLRPAHHLGHYHLAETRYRLGKKEEAAVGFRTVLDRTEEIPYASNARQRLEELERERR